MVIARFISHENHNIYYARHMRERERTQAAEMAWPGRECVLLRRHILSDPERVDLLALAMSMFM